MSALSDIERLAALEAAVLTLASHYRSHARVSEFAKTYRNVAADLDEALSDATALPRLLAEARAEALRQAADDLARKGHRSAVTRLRARADALTPFGGVA